MAAPEHVSLDQAQATIVELLNQRQSSSSICPSEVARALTGSKWRKLMPLVREAARALARGGMIDITQRGQVIAPGDALRGPIRLRKRNDRTRG
jgi:hypothetical protein